MSASMPQAAPTLPPHPLLPDFAAIRPAAVHVELSALLASQRQQIEQLCAVEPPQFATVVEPIERLRHELSRRWSPISHLNAVASNDDLRAAYNSCLPLLADFESDLSQNEQLFAAYQRIAANESASLLPQQSRLLELALRNFRLGGVALKGEKRVRFKTLMNELAQLGSKFDENVLDATQAYQRRVTDPAELAGLSDALIDAAARRARDAGVGGWLLLLDQPTYVAILSEAEHATLRRDFYRAWNTRAADAGDDGGRFDNSQVMCDILARRHEAANLLGFANYADYSLASRMAKSREQVLALLDDLARAARPAAEREYAALEHFAGRPLDAWDITFFSERLQQRDFGISQEELRPYFGLERVLEGMFDVAQRLFGIHIAQLDGVPRWHDDVRFYAVRDRTGADRAFFYLDPYARPRKRSGAWMDDCVDRMRIGQTQALPVAYLVCNSLPPSSSQPALLTHDDTLTLFHEFGHGLHHMLTQVDYPSIAGINGVAWDAVELPSQFMENFAWEPEVLERIAVHYASGAALPPALRQKLVASRCFQAGLATLRQLEFALFDFHLHADYDPARGASVYETLQRVRDQVAIVKPPAWNRMPHSFAHIFSGGYAAGYYSYKWAEVLAADAYGAFREHGVFDAPTAQRFYDAILSRGGSRDELEGFVQFRGRPPTIDALLQQDGIRQ
ncbi:MAG: M3 family metallopeptidase [Steroidobacteraceae bacterium]